MTMQKQELAGARWAYRVLFILHCVMIACTGRARTNDHLPDGFADIGREVPNCVIDIRYAANKNFMGRPLDGYRAGRAWGVRSMVEALKRVQDDLVPLGFRLKIFDAYRPMRAERDMIRWAIDTGRRELLGVYLPSRINPAARFGHVCGNMIDVTIVDESGHELDMGTEFDEFSERAWTRNAAGPVLKNRMLLQKAMRARGFTPYEKEWWHFTYYAKPHPALDVPIE